MGPSPTPSQTSLDKIKFSQIPTTENATATADTATATSTPAPSPIPSSPNPLLPRHQHQQQHEDIVEAIDDGVRITINNRPKPIQLPPSQTALLSSPVENKRWSTFLKVLFYLIVVTVVLVLVSSVVAVTVTTIRENQDNPSSDSISGHNHTDTATATASTTTTSVLQSSSFSSSSSLLSSSSSSSSMTTTTTFHQPECLPTQYQCSNGQCLPLSSRCNKVFECPDYGDEANCTNCHGFECATTKVCLWDRGSRRCDGVIDCGDLTDEIGCSLNPRIHRLCKNGVRISRSSWCDGLDDCRDNSDEAKCTCPRNEVSCEGTRGHCIPSSSKCDGYKDCDNGWDEEECGVCQNDEFRCSDLSCIPRKSQCDGKSDCPGGSGEDETGCVEIQPDTQLVRIVFNNSWIYVCSDGWTLDHSAKLCHGKRRVNTWTGVDVTSSQYAVVRAGSTNVTPGDFDISTTCKTGKVVALKCNDPTCGETKLSSLRNAIAGGELPPLGKWPWVASLAHRGSPICGAVIIDENWVLTAYHCIRKYYSEESTSNPLLHQYTVTFGTISSTVINGKNDDNNRQVRHVTKIHRHPLASMLPGGVIQYDLALLKVSSPVQYSDVVQPICLPEQNQVFPSSSVCFLAGWGLLSDSQHLKPVKLRDTRLRVLSESQCQTNHELGDTTVITNFTVCAGYFYGVPSGCQGDSGGPLMCLETPRSSRPTEYRWYVAGILSRTNSFCGQRKLGSQANLFARVSTSTQWIENTLEAERYPPPPFPNSV